MHLLGAPLRPLRGRGPRGWQAAKALDQSPHEAACAIEELDPAAVPTFEANGPQGAWTGRDDQSIRAVDDDPDQRTLVRPAFDGPLGHSIRHCLFNSLPRLVRSRRFPRHT